MGLNGILNVNKPAGPTSFNIVERVRRITGEKRVGHAGTLDPAAAGVLPICLGQATRISEYLHSFTKEYIALIELGTTTDTYDAEGRVTGRGDTGSITLPLVQATLQSFEGFIDQVPPAFSAIKVNGRQSYDLARAGIQITHQPRKIHIDCIELLDFELPCVKLRIVCSKGTYIRSLANDLGKRLECGAFLKGLIRSVYGPFRIADTVSIEAVQEALDSGNVASLIYPVDYPLISWGKQVITSDEAHSITEGIDIAFTELNPADNIYCRAYQQDGRFLAIMKFVQESGLWHPEKVFNL